MSNDSWFKTIKITHNIYCTTEYKFFESNRANIWLVKGPRKDVIIDTGLGVCNLRQHLSMCKLIEPERKPCEVVCTHAHFDHSGGAHHFNDVFIHEDDQAALLNGRQEIVLNYVKADHFMEKPYDGFSHLNYKVPSTNCRGLQDGSEIDLGNGESLYVIHVPGHTQGSIALYYPQQDCLFSGDFVYDCGHGSNLLDWLPSGSVGNYITSCDRITDWITDKAVQTVYPGHFGITHADRICELLTQYTEDRRSGCVKSRTEFTRCSVKSYIKNGCFRCCPC